MRTIRSLLVSVAALASACGGAAGEPAGTPDPVSGDLTVFAAASLTDAYNQISREFQAAHPAAKVTFNFAGSPTLVTQIQQGAPADVFASADEPNMQRLVDAGQADGTPAVFATNRLQIAVQPGNPRRLAGLADLAKPDLVVVLCAPAVPCGRYAGQAIEKAGVRVSPKSLEQDVKQVVSKVALGEADAGIAYTTDVRVAASRVEAVDIPDSQNVLARYPIVEVKDTRNPTTARAFIEWVRREKGQAVLERLGFGKP